MRLWWRTLALAAGVSFLLGIWFHLQSSQSRFGHRLKEPPIVTLLTEHPQWWNAVKEGAQQEGVARLVILDLPRKDWEGHLRQNPASCSLVAFKSYFHPYFTDNRLIEALPDSIVALSEQIHPDFQAAAKNGRADTLPVLWSSAYWKSEGKTKSNLAGRYQIKTSADEALLLAYDLNLVDLTDEDPEARDWFETASQIWSQIRERLLLAYAGSDTTIPIYPVKASQEYGIWEESSPDSDLPAGGNTLLWTYNLSLCPGQAGNPDLKTFLAWLLEPENMTRLVQDSGLGATLGSLEHSALPEAQRPSAVRRLSLAHLKKPELEWQLAVAWQEVLGKNSVPDKVQSAAATDSIEESE